MLTEQAKEGLARILEISCPDDVKTLAQKFIPAIPHDTSHEEATEAILNHAQKPSEILLGKSIKRDTIIAYLEEIGVSVPEELKKDACIRTCLGKWHVKNDMFWVKPLRLNIKNVDGTHRLDNFGKRKTEEVGRDYQNKTMEILESVQEDNLFHKLNSQREEEEEVQVLAPTSVHRESPSKGLPGSLYINSRSSLSSIYNSPSLTTSQISSEGISSVDQSSTVLSDSFDSAISQLERSQFILPSVPPRCSSAPINCDNQGKSIYVSKNRSSFSLGQKLSSRSLLREPPSTESFGISPDVMDTIGSCSSGIMEGEGGSATVSQTSLSVNSRRICKTERESPEPPSIESASSSPKITRRCTSKPLVRGVSVSNASVQTFLSEIPQFQNTRSSASQTSTGNVRSTQKELLPKKVESYKRRHLECSPEESTISHHKNQNNLPSFPKWKDYTSGVAAMKRNRWTSSPYPEDFQKGRQPTLLECPNCEKQYCLPIHQSEGGESHVLSKSRGPRKKRHSALSKDAPSSKQQRVTLPSKRIKGTFNTVLSRRPLTKTETLKRKYPILPLDEDTLSYQASRRHPASSKQPHYTSAISSEHHKKPKLQLKNTNYSAVANSGKENGDSSESSTDCLPPDNSIDRTNDTPSGPSGPSSVPPELLSVSESKLKSNNCAPDTTDDSSSTESPSSPALEKPLPRPKRHCCTLL